MRLRERPREYEAVQWTGDNYPEVEEFCGGKNVEMVTATIIRILSGYVGIPGDYILKSHEGKLYIVLEANVPGWRYEEIP